MGLKSMKEKQKEDEERYAAASKPKRTVLREVEEIDEFGNVTKVLREVEEEGIKKAPKTRDLKEKIIIDKYGNKKKVLVDDQGNVVDEDDVVYEDEEYIDEFGNKRTRKVEEIDEFGNVRKVLRGVEEEGIKKAPKTRDLRETFIIDKDGNKVKVLIDDQGNVVDQKDVVYEDEEYIDEFGNVRTRKVAKIKKDAMKRMQEKEKKDKERYESASKPKRTVIREVEEIDEFGNVRKVLREVEEEGIKKAPKTRDLK